MSNSRSGRATRTNQASSFLRQAKTGSKPPKGIHHRGTEDAKFGNGFKFGVMAMAERCVTLPESAGKLRTSNLELQTPNQAILSTPQASRLKLNWQPENVRAILHDERIPSYDANRFPA